MKKGTSNKPVILGTLGLLFALPNALISFISGAAVISYGSPNSSDTEVTDYSMFYMKLIFWSALIGFLFSLFAKRLYVLSGIAMIVCGLLIFVSMVTANFFLIFPAAFFIIGGIICFTQRKITISKPINSKSNTLNNETTNF